MNFRQQHPWSRVGQLMPSGSGTGTSDGSRPVPGLTPFVAAALSDPAWRRVNYRIRVLGDSGYNILDMNRVPVGFLPRGTTFWVWQESVANPGFKRIALNSNNRVDEAGRFEDQPLPQEVWLPESEKGVRWEQIEARSRIDEGGGLPVVPPWQPGSQRYRAVIRRGPQDQRGPNDLIWRMFYSPRASWRGNNYTFDGQVSTLREGDIINVLTEGADGWWLIQKVDSSQPSGVLNGYLCVRCDPYVDSPYGRISVHDADSSWMYPERRGAPPSIVGV